MDKKKIRRGICMVWLAVAVILLIVVYMYSGDVKGQEVISKVVWIYVFASCILAGIVYSLRDK